MLYKEVSIKSCLVIRVAAMKFSLIQCDVRDGDIAGNVEKIIRSMQAEAARDSRLCIVPAQAICGPLGSLYSCQPDFIYGCRKACEYMASSLASQQALLCAVPARDNGGILISNGNVLDVPANFYFGGERIVIGQSPQALLAENHTACDADFIICMNAMPFAPGDSRHQEDKLCEIARERGAIAAYVNLCGGYGSQIYAGGSAIASAAGCIVARAKAFAEDILAFDSDGKSGRIEPACPDIDAEQWHALVLGVADFVHKSGSKKALLGLSGGMDSALVACIAVEALGPENVTGVLMPSPYTGRESVRDALELAKNLGISTYTLAIEKLMLGFSDCLAPVLDCLPPPENDTTFENLQARIRGTLLMAIANRSGALVLNTGNKSELAMGYNTLYGDTVGAVSVLGDIFKTRVYEIARWYCNMKGKMIIPENIFLRPPSAELRPDQKDADSLPPYEELDATLAELLQANIYKTDLSEISSRMDEARKKIFASAFKRAQSPLPLLVSGLPLGICQSAPDGNYRI